MIEKQTNKSFNYSSSFPIDDFWCKWVQNKNNQLSRLKQK
jgi:hypothetical protein